MISRRALKIAKDKINERTLYYCRNCFKRRKIEMSDDAIMAAELIKISLKLRKVK